MKVDHYNATHPKEEPIQVIFNFDEDIEEMKIAKGIEEFAVVSQAYDPSYTADLSKEAINNESLVFADKLVNAGYATWKQGWNMNEVRKTLHNWQTSINANRLRNILGKDEVEKELL